MFKDIDDKWYNQGYLLRFLREDGISENDLRIFYRLRDLCFSTYVHGSLIRNQLKYSSDIDFAVVGDLGTLTQEFMDVFGIQTSTLLSEPIDYISTAFKAGNGRRLSVHLEQVNFRENYPNLARPYAVEYRPQMNAKRGDGLSKYRLAGFDRGGNSLIFKVICPQREISTGHVNTTPQTGIFDIEDGHLVSHGESSNKFEAKLVDSINVRTGNVPNIIGQGTEIFLLGLESDKMSSEVPFISSSDYVKHVREPQNRSMAAAEEFLGEDAFPYLYACMKMLTASLSLKNEGGI